MNNEDDFVIFKTNPKVENISFYWKDDDGRILRSVDNLKKKVEREDKYLKFAMNGGMFTKNNFPKGLYIEDFKILNKIDTLSGEGNFYLNPNGIFYLTKNNDAELIETKKFKHDSSIKYATQSGPMLLINDEINPIFEKDSKNLNIRNGVGILKNGNVVFVMSKNEVNFYNFASIFKELGCTKALYLDGFVSRTYYPEGNWIQKDGDFGVMIGITESKK
ncbi:phosphodiester glycosidase family protein [Chryseobacterium sp. C-71]|uniref:phosphodiester glycosidase family protein n=1 Tax=Chryseobacterium sp. C-71 TaxID=2893882 RepID=UPI001E48CB1A|nr:phosphodiester glycosidase family protein [Chryseobacterium sp. C-71]UFH31033.1 phosphodiester glycosidase family protein [Chryseobacterium sp. C-71]